jgi:predicted glycosyltransferase
MIAVTHLLGAGHLTRAAALARAFAAKDHAVTLVSGGLPSRLIPFGGADLVQLPPVRTTGTDFRTLLDADGSPIGEDRLAARKDVLLDTLRTVRPDVVVTELFPFGRRGLASEFLALLAAAHALRPRPLIACSVRDVLVAPALRDRIDEAHERLCRFYDLVLVHGDPNLVRLDESWPLADRIRPMIRYTGYVDEGGTIQPPAERRGIVVSGGSSAASLPLYRAVLEAAERLPGRAWTVLVGSGIGEDALAGLREAAPPQVSVERARPDFRALLAEAAVSVSQAGYNTVVDLLSTGPAAVLVPFEADHETEQRLRADRLASRGLATVLREAELSGSRLAQAIEAAEARPPPPHAIALDGAAKSVDLLERALRTAPSVHSRWDWRPLSSAIGRAHEAGWEPAFWWRDDDAVADTPALRRLLALSRRYRSPIAVAVIPKLAEPGLEEALETWPDAAALVHGLFHRNHAHAGEKKAEFGQQRPLSMVADDARAALMLAREICPAKLLPVFVPPWNRIAPALVPILSKLGFRGLSTFLDRERPTVDGLLQVNTHLDPVDWRGTRSARSPDALIAETAAAVGRRLAGLADRGEPIGLLTHHGQHDEPVWTVCEALLEHLARHEVAFTAAQHVFSDDNRIGVGL